MYLCDRLRRTAGYSIDRSTPMGVFVLCHMQRIPRVTLQTLMVLSQRLNYNT